MFFLSFFFVCFVFVFLFMFFCFLFLFLFCLCFLGVEGWVVAMIIEFRIGMKTDFVEHPKKLIMPTLVFRPKLGWDVYYKNPYGTRVAKLTFWYQTYINYLFSKLFINSFLKITKISHKLGSVYCCKHRFFFSFFKKPISQLSTTGDGYLAS